MSGHDERILILDFGSQYTQLIARRIREQRVYCEIRPCTDAAPAEVPADLRGIVLSGGPDSVLNPGAPPFDPAWLGLPVPILGICYGMQLMAHLGGGVVEAGRAREYGLAELELTTGAGPPFAALPERSTVWMSHGDHVAQVPPGWRKVGRSEGCPVVAMVDSSGDRIGLQFHPEVAHTAHGTALLREFLFGVCKVHGRWTMADFVEEQVRLVRERVGSSKVICGLSGGVDSAVAAALVHRAIGDQLTCVFVDNGLLRKGEREQVAADFPELDLRVVEASERFLRGLTGVTDPERKRKVIGETFIRVFEAATTDIDAPFLVQGTLYPDVIESVSFKGPSATIKSHHNVGGLPADLRFQLIEPLRELFKDEVRALGEALGLPESRVWRQPFPGPGLAVRVLGEVTRERCDLLREADAIVQQEIEAAGLTRTLWQSFAVLLPVRSVGVMGDERTYENACVVRAVTSTDGMTADWARLPYELLGRMSRRIINEVRGINRVCYDVSSKPPGTIEWE